MDDKGCGELNTWKGGVLVAFEDRLVFNSLSCLVSTHVSSKFSPARQMPLVQTVSAARVAQSLSFGTAEPTAEWGQCMFERRVETNAQNLCCSYPKHYMTSRHLLALSEAWPYHRGCISMAM